MAKYGLNFIPHHMSQPGLVDVAEQLIDRWCKGLDLSVIYDIGANIGVYSCIFEKKFPNAKIFAFEPIYENFDLILKHFFTNNIKATAINMALWDKVETIKLGIPTDRDKNNTGLYTTFCDDANIVCDAVPLDHLNYLPEPDFVKLDVEGAEDKVLLGGQRLLKKSKYIVVEKNTKNRNKDFPDYSITENILQSWNFEKIISGFDELWRNNVYS